MSRRTALTALIAAVAAGGLLAPASGGAASPPEFTATVAGVPEDYRDHMIAVGSWKPGCPVPIDDLRIIEMSHRTFEGGVAEGRLMVHEDVTDEVVEAFATLFEAGYPIRRMELIEAYGADDNRSMDADNTSAFNCRPITGTTDRFSIHSYGKAIDVNPVENPYVRGDTVLPPAGAAYLDREDVRPGMITKNDVVEKAFRTGKFFWGGDYNSLKDYQHFESKKL